ncbi:LCP family protein [Paenibacillus paeoniae]|uniref:LytR family transcriptional regulator n=1 Tax=Paenibacillus paeoniae TaxID=2292705 RepID=A0A371PKD8_9BACL|nr:LCP family protein [Paenibacillus paeoniae]REK76227.1 LytR family transcriptional regulator [Paenibacillus paeoniae]
MSQQPNSLPPRSSGRKSPSTKSGKEKKSKKRRPLLRVFFFLLFGLLLTAAALIVVVALKTSDAIDTIAVNDPEATPVPITESVKQKPVAFVLMGIDSRDHGGGLNTDVMMVAAFNPVTKKATVVAIPRDTYVDVEGYRARKANRFYADSYVVATRDKGMKKEAADLEAKKAVKEVMGKLFDIDIKYASMINFQGFSDVVDALGGVTVNVDMRMKYKDTRDGTNIDLQPGIRELDGKETLDFVRYRKSNDGKNMSSDFDRNRRQTEVIGAIVDKLVSLGGITKIGSVIDAVGKNISADMQRQEITRMIETYYSVRSSDIEFLSLEGVWRSPNVYVDEASLAKVKAALQAKMAE